MINTDGHVIVSRDVKHVENKCSHVAEIMGASPELNGTVTTDDHTAPSATCSSVSLSTPDLCDSDIDDSLTEQFIEPLADNEQQQTSITPPLSRSTASASPAQSLNDDVGNDTDAEAQHSYDDFNFDAEAGDMDGSEYNSTNSSDNEEVEPLNSSDPPRSTPIITETLTRSGRVSKPVVRYGTVSIGI